MLEPNATLTHARGLDPQNPNFDLLFPEQILNVRGKYKRRGGAPVYCPNVGTVPLTKDYAKIWLPIHGLVRRNIRKSHLTVQYGESALFEFMEPWHHQVTVTVLRLEDPVRLVHEIKVVNESIEAIPISIGFCPHFATHGKPFVVKYRNGHLASHHMPDNIPILIPKSTSADVRIIFERGEIILTFLEDTYTHFYVWTDAIDKYICVVPVHFGIDDTLYTLLAKGEYLTGKCSVTYLPR